MIPNIRLLRLRLRKLVKCVQVEVRQQLTLAPLVLRRVVKGIKERERVTGNHSDVLKLRRWPLRRYRQFRFEEFRLVVDNMVQRILGICRWPTLRLRRVVLV